MDLPSRLRVCIDAGVDGGIAIRLRRVVGVVGGIGCGGLALVGQDPSHHLAALTISVCPRLKKQQVHYRSSRIELNNKEMDLRTHLALNCELERFPWWCDGPPINKRFCRPASCFSIHSAVNHLSTMSFQ
jgi:hypothetical protein